jgi:peptidoglycan/LPS O-acetylase OafA/YrhL
MKLHGLTVLRGMAAWWVVFYHFKTFLSPYLSPGLLALIKEGDLAVDLFFCLSGFVIYINYSDLSLDPGSIRRFIIKRFARLYPAHVLILFSYLPLVAIYAFFSKTGLQGDRFTVGTFVLNILLLQNWLLAENLSWNVPAWSISAEFAAYLLFPAIIFFGGVYKSSLKRLSLLLILSWVFLLLLFLPYSWDLGRAIPTLGVPRCVFQFCMGCVAGEIFRKRPDMPQGRLLWLALGGVFFIVVYARGVLPSAVCMPPISFLLILGLAWLKINWEANAIARSFIYLGEISYATYICHYWVYDVFKILFVRADFSVNPLFLLGAFVALGGLSALLYHYVEQPMFRLIVNRLGAASRLSASARRAA